mmetsp:Transcript_42854/g.113487  ORF Transcript_42854/g.113487 Transcript_42854/m.113487 type:complete len:130 (-) Transcript_42854:78-467(-)|eukprot:7383372-Prymnesium_polylepis.1
MKRSRKPPLSPDAFAAHLRSCVERSELEFTAKADLDVVIEQYACGFVHAIENYKATTGKETIYFDLLKWSDEECDVLIDALRYSATHCSFAAGELTIQLAPGNEFSKGMKARLKELNETEFAGKFACVV